MRARLLVTVCVLLLPAPASADVRVMCYGDSITAGSDMSQPENSYPGQLQRLRPDLEVVNDGRRGDVSDDLERFRAALADWPPQLVVLMLGTNDAVCSADTPFCESSTATPERTVANLFRMADEARRAGAAVIILTPPPAVCTESCQGHHELEFGTALRHAFTGRVADELLRARPPKGVRVADLRRRFTDASWEALSEDGLHPSTEGNRVIAQFVAAWIPKRDTHTPVEPDPFARRPHGGRTPRGP